MRARGWDSVDVVFVSGDAYVDHPSFANGLLARLLEAAGFRVAVLAQPDWRSCEPWRQFGRPRLCFGISAGNMDSMINHYTANRKVRNDDAYSPDGVIGRRPDRATLAYCQRAREAFPGVPVVAGPVSSDLPHATAIKATTAVQHRFNVRMERVWLFGARDIGPPAARSVAQEPRARQRRPPRTREHAAQRR